MDFAGFEPGSSPVVTIAQGCLGLLLPSQLPSLASVVKAVVEQSGFDHELTLFCHFPRIELQSRKLSGAMR